MFFVGCLCDRRKFWNRVGNLQSIFPFVLTRLTFKALLEHNAKVIMCARNVEKSKSVIERLKQVTGKDSIYFIKLDLADLSSCAQAARELMDKEERLDILFLNALATVP